jgi:hypothetical protein
MQKEIVNLAVGVAAVLLTEDGLGGAPVLIVFQVVWVLNQEPVPILLPTVEELAVLVPHLRHV